MDERLLTAQDRATLREFAVNQMIDRPGLLEYGAKVADELRQLVPALADEQIGAVMACAAQIAGQHAAGTACPHVHRLALLMQAAAVDLAHLELDPPGRP